MKFVEMYEKISALIAMEIFDEKETTKALEEQFANEFQYLKNMNLSLFKTDKDEQFNILRIYDIYFRVGKPLIEDTEYDMYYGEYKKDDIDDELAPIIFEPNVSAWKKEKHQLVMGSLSKCNTLEEVEKWNTTPKIIKAKKVVSEKLDGISLECIYKGGVFTQAITRGDGLVGEDITLNAIYFDGVVKELGEKMDCAIRGELVITKENFHKINAILVANGKDPLKNTRNGVAGQATKFKDRNEEILSLLTFIAYEIQVFGIEETGETIA